MCKMKICLIGGGELKSKRLINLNKRLLSDLKNPKIIIFQLTSTYTQAKKYLPLLKKHFKRVSSNLVFVDNRTKFSRIKKEMKNAEVIYFPGGNTDLLIQKMKSLKIIPLIKKFKGWIIGISAGAYALSKSHLKIDNSSFKEIPSFGIAKLRLKAHYKKSMDQSLLALSTKEKIYALKDNSAIILNGKKKIIVGDVFLFYKNKKRKLH